ncbi:hypothetical protein [uncultured Desulfuromusa sp.]|uniref:hypothetical protein n=1 Tax=uncultured Desulfuromusa sp. TaxID=219183 RepID=UPI002AA65CC6|nr:hypothetical protein [uncultured Desulfuromusa sp.]
MRYGLFILITIFLFCTAPVFAHSPFMACYDNGDQTITCYGEFSDGSSASSIPIRIIDTEGNVLLSGVMDELGEFNFERPEAPFTVIFDAGPGHIVKEKSANITQ